MTTPSGFDPMQSLVRLIFGGVTSSPINLRGQLEQWETQTEEVLEERRAEAEQPHALATTGDDHAHAIKPYTAPRGSESESDQARLMLVGLLVETQTRIQQAFPRNAQPPAFVTAMLREYETNPALHGLREQVDTLAARGERELHRLMEVGRAEEEHSQVLFQTAIRTTTQSTIHEITSNTEVRELVQQQSMGVATEIVEEIREHGISLDNFIERNVRRLLRLRPRYELPLAPFADPNDPAYIGRPRAVIETMENA